MRKLLLLVLFLACAAPIAVAQGTDDYDRVKFFVGYSHNRVDVGATDNDPDVDDIFDEREGFHGINASITGNVSRYVGLKFDYSYHARSLDPPGFDRGTDARIHNILGGVHFQDNTRDPTNRVRPFAHALIGAGVFSVDLTDLDDDFEDVSETGLAGALGGGVDFRISERVDIRAIQFDWNPTRINGQTLHNFRIGVGVVFR